MKSDFLFNYNVITSTFSKDVPEWNTPTYKHLENEDETLETASVLKVAKRFILDAEKSQLFYEDIKEEKIQHSLFNQFQLPFEQSLFVFQNPFLINWLNKEQVSYGKQKLIGILAYSILPKTTDEVENPNTGDMGQIDAQTFKLALFFNEGDQGGNPVVSHQWIKFMVLHSKIGEKENIIINHLYHYPCQNKILCCLGKDGSVITNKIKDFKPFYCQEVLVRDALLETLCFIVNKIHEVQVEYVAKKANKAKKDHFIQKPDLFTKGNKYKENYVQYLDGKRKVYPKNEVAIGTGVSHKHRYDVRRHPRIVNGRLIWIHEHQRGSGKYLPKIYANRKTWFVNNLWYQVEKLSKHRIVEVILVKVFYLLKELRGNL